MKCKARGGLSTGWRARIFLKRPELSQTRGAKISMKMSRVILVAGVKRGTG